MALERSQQQHIVSLAERLSPEQLEAAIRFMQSLLADPVALSLLTAPPDDEPETEDERRAVEAARNDPSPTIPHEEILREFGL